LENFKIHKEDAYNTVEVSNNGQMVHITRDIGKMELLKETEKSMMCLMGHFSKDHGLMDSDPGLVSSCGVMVVRIQAHGI
jgi:hypothetical protein